MKRKIVSICCNSSVKVSVTKDFLGDKESSLGTAYYICTKCNKPCDITGVKKK